MFCDTLQAREYERWEKYDRVTGNSGVVELLLSAQAYSFVCSKPITCALEYKYNFDKLKIT